MRAGAFACAALAALMLAGISLGAYSGAQSARHEAEARYVASVAPNPLALNINRPFVILLGVLMLGAAIFGGSFVAGRHACATMMSSTDDLSWLRTEFHLSDAEMARARQVLRERLKTWL